MADGTSGPSHEQGLDGGSPALPSDASAAGHDALNLTAGSVQVRVDLGAGGRIASFAVDGRELLKTAREGPYLWGAFPMVPYAGRVRDASFTFEGREHRLPATMPPHAIHGTVLDRAWEAVDERTIATDLGPDWPFRGRVTQQFDLSADRMTCRIELDADEPMPASVGWHPWFLRRIEGVDADLELDFEAGAMYARDDAGIATARRVVPPPGPWDDCFTDVRRSPIVRWPGFLELTIESACPAWVVYTQPEDTICVEPQTAPPDALNSNPTVVRPGAPLLAEMTWRWRRLSRRSSSSRSRG